MKTLFEIEYIAHKPHITPTIRPEAQWVIDGLGTATVKLDGQACAVIDGEIYTRYDQKKNRVAPAGSIPCQPLADPITGHHPHWTPATAGQHKHVVNAFQNQPGLPDGTYEIVGPHFQGNPEEYDVDTLVKHGDMIIQELTGVPLSYEIIKAYLEDHNIEGIVFHNPNHEFIKIRRKDFGIKWGK